MSTAVNGNEFHFHFGVVAPATWLRSAKYWPDSRDDRTLPRPMNKPNNLTSPPSNGFKGSIVPFMIMTDEVLPASARLQLPPQLRESGQELRAQDETPYDRHGKRRSQTRGPDGHRFQ